MKVTPSLGMPDSAMPQAPHALRAGGGGCSCCQGGGAYQFKLQPDAASKPTGIMETIQRLSDEIDRTQQQIGRAGRQEASASQPNQNKSEDSAAAREKQKLEEKLAKLVETLTKLIQQLLKGQESQPPSPLDGRDGQGDDEGLSSGESSSPVQGPSGGSPVNGAGGLPGPTALPEPTSGPVSPSSELTRFAGVNDAKLQDHINKLATDPEGKNLLADAKRRGVKIKVGDVKDGTLAHFDPNSNTIVLGRATMAQGTGLASLVHELVHATTPHDGDSKHEEGMANVIGNRIASRIQGTRPGNPTAIYNSTVANYGGLANTNPGFDDNIRRVLGGFTAAA